MQIRSGEGPKEGRKRMRSRERSKEWAKAKNPSWQRKNGGEEVHDVKRRDGGALTK